MAHVVTCPDTMASTDDKHPAESQTSTVSHAPMTTVHVHTPARTARELVSGQEMLMGLLQDLRFDLARMDREASRIKDDVMRSTQIFPRPIIADAWQEYPRPAAYAGYQSSPGLPPRYRRRHADNLDMTSLNRLSTRSSRSSTPSRLVGRRRRESDDSCRSDLRHVQTLGRRRSSVRTTLGFSTDASYSGNDSDLESTSSLWSRDTYISSISRDSSPGNHYDEDGQDRPRSSTLDRRSSYFYTNSNHVTARQVVSDDNVSV